MVINRGVCPIYFTSRTNDSNGHADMLLWFGHSAINKNLFVDICIQPFHFSICLFDWYPADSSSRIEDLDSSGGRRVDGGGRGEGAL